MKKINIEAALVAGLLFSWVLSEASAAEKVLNTDDLNVTAPEFVEDLGITKDKATSTIQSATQKDFQREHVTNIAEFLGSSGQSVNVNEFQGNSFQIDVNYRGFTASPLLGTPQGLSVYLDGVRINEPFGDVVNWDLIPMSAISRMDLVSGSNPAFGLNTLGGAIALRTRNGFDDPGFRFETSAGSWGRNTYQVTSAGSSGPIAGFFTYNQTDEDGWRQFAPSKLKQAFGRVDLRMEKFELNASMLWGDTDLTGNGLTPKYLLQQQWNRVLTSPDSTANQLNHFNLSGKYFINDNSDLSATAYHRASQRQTINGDINDSDSFTGTDFNLKNSNLGGGSANWLTAAQNDIFGNGYNTCRSSPLTGGPLVCESDVTGNGDYRFTDSGYAPIAFIHRSYTDQSGKGLGLKYNWATDRHNVMIGSAYDTSRMSFKETMQYATIDDQHRVVPVALTALGDVDPSIPFNGNGNAIQNGEYERVINLMSGTTKSAGAYISHVWTPVESFSLTTALRYNVTHVKTQVVHNNLRFDLNQIPTATPEVVLSGDDAIYRKLLPAVGFTWDFTKSATLFGGVSHGMRAPTPVELGCAKMTADYIAKNTAGMTPDEVNTYLRQHELNCSVQTILTNDPPLKAVKSTAVEVGLRGKFGKYWSWNTAVYRTELYDDILFDLDAVSFHTHFFNADHTRREGIEFGLGGDFGQWKFQASYGLTSATYQSSFENGNHSNSSCTGPLSNCTFTVQPGDRMPSVPLRMAKLNIGWDVTPKFTATLSAIAQSFVYLRGNENNQAQATAKYCVAPFANPDGTCANGIYQDKGTAPGYVVVNLNLNWKPLQNWEVFAKINNLFDRKYYTAGQLRQDPFTPDAGGTSFVGSNGWNYNSDRWANVANLAPGAPRAAWIGVAYTFDGKADKNPNLDD